MLNGDANKPDVSARIRDWQNRLLQLDRRNNLLFFREGRSAIRIIGHTPDSISEELLNSRNGLMFDYVELLAGLSSIRDAQGDEEEDSRLRVRKGDLDTDLEPLELQRRLRRLMQKDKEWEEEQGFNVLFVAVGFLNWVDVDGEAAKAPLILIPCDLTRPSPRDHFFLSRESDDATSNVTLAHMLTERYGVGLPHYTDDVEPSEYIRSVDDAVRDREDWHLDTEVFLATFSFNKLAMWQDLERMRINGTEHPMIRRLAGESIDLAGVESKGSLPDDRELAGGRLDDLLPIHDQYTVKPADFSQMRAIHHARIGQNLVIHGPPGTGKSETITNIIASLIGEGKTVLFVSEKMAALDVVKRRLEETGLGVFALDMHSHRGKKSSVYEQLKECLDDPRLTGEASVSLGDLEKARSRLNDAVRALHELRQPLGTTVYQVQGEYARLVGAPAVRFSMPQPERISAAMLTNIVEKAERVARRPSEFLEHMTSIWRPLRASQPTLQLADEVKQDSQRINEVVGRLADQAAGWAEWLGLALPENLDEVARLQPAYEHLGKGEAVPGSWLDRSVLQALERIADEQWKQQEIRAELVKEVSAGLAPFSTEIDYHAAEAAMDSVLSGQEHLKNLIGGDWSRTAAQSPEHTLEVAEGLGSSLDRLGAATEKVAGLLGAKRPEHFNGVTALAGLARQAVEVAPVTTGWIRDFATGGVEKAIDKAEGLSVELASIESELAKTFDLRLVDSVVPDLLVRYRIDSASPIRWLKPQFRSDNRLVQGNHTGPGKLDRQTAIRGLDLSLQIRDLREVWRRSTPLWSDLLGDRFSGRGTNWGDLRRASESWQGLTSDGRIDASFVDEVSTNPTKTKALEEALRDVEYSLSQIRKSANELDSEELAAPDTSLRQVSTIVENGASSLRSIIGCLVRVRSDRNHSFTSLRSVQALLNKAVQVANIDQELGEMRNALGSDFGARYKGSSTDWAEVRGALQWTQQYLELGDRRPTRRYLAHASDPADRRSHADAVNEMAMGVRAFHELFTELSERFDPQMGNWESWSSAGFGELIEWAHRMAQGASSANAWVEYAAAVRDLEELTQTGLCAEIRAHTDDAGDVPDVVKRRILESWLQALMEADPRLGHVTALEQEAVRTQFRELDRRFPLAARDKVRAECFRNYPSQASTYLQGGQLQILQREVSKRRRQLSVRRLLTRIPQLVQKLKPVFMMSPLAVSQYLQSADTESERITFDAIIFDEASQVFPEDAVPAIERGEQVIVVGDQEQLPPSNFFRRSLSDDSDVDDDDDTDSDMFLGRESILDVMVGFAGTVVHEETLRVHYRSRSGDLIRFSNHSFYDDRLLVFPDPRPATIKTALNDFFLPDARYDPAAGRVNRGEAQKVCEWVLELMSSVPAHESIGVVALSRAQADYIRDMLDSIRMERRDLDNRFSPEMLEPFFVKNLENVQGDERDHMILSIGYGPTVGSGAVPNRFGPINQEGGHRRLNVAITRARKSMTVVHSLKASDIRSEQPGAVKLREYLEYVQDPTRYFESKVSINPDAEPESPFEEAVLAALQKRGHSVDVQVGVTGYRIDLAIKARDGTSYDLGIECDGLIAHRTPAARDRDWLRQSVLEGLGWNIHRIWSTAWIRNPDREIAAVEAALEKARSRTKASIPSGPPAVDVANPSSDGQTVIDSREQPGELGGPDQRLFDEYQVTDLSDVATETSPELRYAGDGILRSMILPIVECEWPVHLDLVIERIRNRYGVGRAGSAIREQIGRMVIRLVDGGDLAGHAAAVETETEFLALPTQVDPPRPRGTMPDGSTRPINLISISEIIEGAVVVAGAMYGAEQQDLIRETARQFGYSRTGAEIADRIGAAVDIAIQLGRLQNLGGMISPP